MKNIAAGIAITVATVTSATAVEYELPSGSDVALAQLMTIPEYELVCDSDTVVESPCDVPEGEYHLVVFDNDWVATHQDLAIGQSTDPSPFSMTLVTEECPGRPNSKFGCRAQCPVGAVATGGACSVTIDTTVSGVASELHYTCTSRLPPNDPTAIVIASVYCLSQ